MTVFAVDLRLGRVCLFRTDITESIREQQGLLNMMAYTFELMGFINVRSERLTLYTRQTVLENLPPHRVDKYDEHVDRFISYYGLDEGVGDTQRQFKLKTLLHQLAEKPAGFDFVLPYQVEGETRYKQINVLWGDENHRTICLVRADVTDMLAAERATKKALEQALVAAKEASLAKSDFLSAMSHDIRTPMNAIMGMTALAVAHMDDPERVADCLKKISISSKHLLSLINDILDMSKIERSKITLNRTKISLSDLLEQLSAMMGPQARAAGISLAFETSRIRHGAFYGDMLRLNQILINLLSYAIKFTPEGGRVDVLVEELSLKDERCTARYRFSVRDSGIGISESDLMHIFEPFTRSRGAERIEGTGLGLSVTKGLVDRMGGEIAVESEPGKGSTFYVELSFETVQDETADAGKRRYLSKAAPRCLAGRRFLVAEDNAINSEILCELLKMDGAETVVTNDGAQVVHAFQQAAPGTFDAVLMDIQMPVMNGYEATRSIRELQRPDAGTIPIIAMTANAFAEDVQASLQAGMNAHVAKPIDMTVLRDTLLRALDGGER